MYFYKFPWSIMFFLFRKNQFIRVLYWEIEMLLLEWIYQSSVCYDSLLFSPFLSLAPILRIFLHYITRKDRAVETISPTRRRRKKENLCVIILSFLSKVAYYLPAKIIACKMLQENMKILFSQTNICHSKWIIFTSGRQRLKTSQLSRIFSSPVISALKRLLTLVQQWQPLFWLTCMRTCSASVFETSGL